MNNSASINNDNEQRGGSQARPRFDWPKLRKAIEFYEKERLCYLPAGWGRKNPSLDEWQPYQTRLPTIEEKAEWFHEGKPTNIGVLCGGISGGLVILAFNDQGGAPEFFGEEQWQKLPQATFITQAVRGPHVWLRSDTPIKSQFISKGKNESWLEIRSDGNFTVVPPSLHPSGVLYQAVGVDRIYKSKDLAGFINKRLAELGLKAREAREAPKERARPSAIGRPERSDELNALAVEKLLKNCAFVKHCLDDAATLSEPHWWSMICILISFGEPGKQKIHEFSQPYPGYTEEKTDKKIEWALKAREEEKGPHLCEFIKDTLNFSCPADCLAKKENVKSPAGLASILAAQELRSPYFYRDKSGNLKLDMETLTKDILSEFKFITLLDTEEVLVWDDGYWWYGGEEKIKAEAEKRVGLSKLLTVHVINEIIGHIQRSTYTARALLNQTPKVINLKNGLLDIRTRELKPHAPEFFSTIRIPVAYDPNADCPRIKQFFAEVLEPQDIPVIHELAGYALIPDYSIQRAFLFIGDGSNGKSTLLSLLRTFLGKDNCSSVPWHALEYSRFASSRLDGKLLNIYADLPSRSMDSTGAFKMLTGGDAISAEKKFKDGYSFVNFARLVFSANKPPRILDEDSYAFWRRWIIINFPNQFPENDPKTDPEILNKLTTETELSGLLNLALDGLQRVLTNAKFSYGKTVDQTQSYYLRASDPVYAFVEDCCELDSDAVTSKDVLFEAFKNYCKEGKTPLINRDSFAKALKNSPHFRVTLTRPTVDGERVHSWRGIKLVNPVQPVQPVQLLGVTLRDAREGGVNGVDKDVGKVNKSKRKRADTSDRLDDQKSSDIIPDYPTAPCPTCGSINFWLTPDNRWLCERCHPKPGSNDNAN